MLAFFFMDWSLLKIILQKMENEFISELEDWLVRRWKDKNNDHIIINYIDKNKNILDTK